MKRHKLAKKHEKEIAKVISGRRQPFSGTLDFYKEDVESPYYLGQCKETEKESISIKLDWLKILTQRAMAKNKIPVLFIRFSKSGIFCDKDWVLLPLKEFFYE